MELEIKLFSYTDKALDGSTIPKESVEKYINSDDWVKRKRTLSALGGITHKDRDTSDGMKVGKDDRVLVNSNSTHCIKDIFFKDEDDKFVYAIIKIFSEDQFDDETAQKIKKLKALLRNGVKLPVSLVLDAYWDHAEVAREIISFRGCDWTLNPGFKGSEVTRILKDD
jgi:hypothetical protein